MSHPSSFWSKLLPFSRTPSIDRYHVTTVTVPEELLFPEFLPLEIRYLLSIRPARLESLRGLLTEGFAVGIRSIEKTPERILRAVDHISRETQHNTVLPWLERLLREEELPVFTEEELRRAEAKGINLYEDARTILAQRFEFKKIILVPLKNQEVTPAEQQLVREMNEDLYHQAIETILHRVTFDNAHTRTEVAQSIIKALIVIGPIAHGLEHLLSGLGKVFAASADDLLSETAELFALRGSGFTWRQLARRSRVLIPVFILATYGAFQVEPLIAAGRVGLAGVIFGLSAVALSLVTALQSIAMYRESYRTLLRENKIRLLGTQTTFRLALRQDFTNPARLGLFMGAAASPVVSAFVFSYFSSALSNGWVLALLGSVESLVAGITVVTASRLEKALFRARMRRELRRIAGGGVR
jgi:hypothetical protein